MESGVTEIKSYFPNGEWVNLDDYSDIVKADDPSGGELKSLTLNNDKDTALVAKHLRPGKLIPFQDNSKKSYMTTKDILAVDISLIISRDNNGHSEGKVFLDQGESISELTNKQYEYY